MKSLRRLNPMTQTFQHWLNRLREALRPHPPFMTASLIGGLWLFRDHPMSAYVYSDMSTYHNTAAHIAKGIFLARDMVYPPGYSLIASGIVSLGLSPLSWMPVLHWLGFLLSMALTVSATRRIFGDRAATLCAWLFAFHFPLYSASGFFLPEILFTALLSALFLTLARPMDQISDARWLGSGLILGLAQFLKGLHVFAAPLWCLALLLTRDNRRAHFRSALKVMTGFCIGLGLLAAFYSMYYGVIRVFPSNGAVNLVEGKCPEKLIRDSEGAFFISPRYAQTGQTQTKNWNAPFYNDRYFWSAGLDCIRANPSLLITEFRQNFYLFFANIQWPESTTSYAPWIQRYSRLFTFTLLIALLLSFVLTQKQFIFPPHHSIAVPLSALFCAMWVFKAEMRYRVPFDPFLLSWLSAVLTRSFPSSTRSKDSPEIRP